LFFKQALKVQNQVQKDQALAMVFIQLLQVVELLAFKQLELLVNYHQNRQTRISFIVEED